MGVERGLGHYPVMVVLHTGLLVGAVVEVVGRRPALPPVARLADARPGGRQPGAALVVHQRRSAARGAPGWSSCPAAELVRSGPYRRLRHPNYVAVVVEGFALPLVHTAWVTALVFTLANAALLRVRIRCEDAALRELAAPETSPA